MTTDPLAQQRARLARATAEFKTAADAHAAATAAIADLHSFIGSKPAERLAALQARRDKATRASDDGARAVGQALAEQKRLEATLPSVFSLGKMFGEEAKRTRVAIKLVKERAAALASQQAAACVEAEALARDAVTLAADMERFARANLVSLQHQAAATLADREARRVDADDAAGTLRAIEQRCGALLDQHASLCIDRRRWQDRIGDAETLDRLLSTDRPNARVYHRRSEEQFGVGSPSVFIRDASRKVRQLDRDIEKLDRRIADEVNAASRRVEAIVIDGLNLCYENRRFVGLAPVCAIANLLIERHAVTVYLDSDIRGRLRMNDVAIARMFDPRVQVRVTPTATKADRLLLEAARDLPGCYVLSNDRFADYPDMAAVAQHRLIRHQVADGRVVVPSLAVNVAF